MTQRADATAKSTVRHHLRVSARNRLLELGPQSLSDVELVAMLLAVPSAQCAHARATQLLATHGTIRMLLNARPGRNSSGSIDDRSYAVLQAALELAKRHYQELMQLGPVLSNAKATREYLRMRLRDLPHEVFGILYLNNRHRVLRFSELFRGTIDRSSVHPREVVKEALANNAAAAILVHNHPCGVAEPSPLDELITCRLVAALSLVDIQVIDHLIVGDGAIESFAERGLL